MRFDTAGLAPTSLPGAMRNALDLELLLGHPQHQDERGVQAQGLFDGRLQSGHVPQRLVAHLLAVGVELVELGPHRGQLVGMAQQLDERPRRGARGGVVPGEHHRDEHARDHVGGEARRAVLLADRHQDVEEVAVVVGRGPARRCAGP